MKPNNYYLKKLFEYFGGSTDIRRSDIWYLREIATLSEDYSPITPTTLSLTVDKNIVVTNGTCTLSATVLDENDDPCKGKTVTFSFAKGNVEFDTTTETTDDEGVATTTYNATGKGDITVTAILPHLSESVSIEDCVYYNDGTVNDLVCASGTTVTVENGALKITTTTSGEKKFYYPTPYFMRNANVMMELESALEDETGNVLGIGIHYNTNSSSQGYAGYWDDHWEINLNNSSKTVSHTLTKGDKIKFVREMGVSRFYHNDDLIDSQSRYIDSYHFGGYTNKNRVQRIKNIKIKAL